jgi:hypothetical protein
MQPEPILLKQLDTHEIFRHSKLSSGLYGRRMPVAGSLLINKPDVPD